MLLIVNIFTAEPLTYCILKNTIFNKKFAYEQLKLIDFFLSDLHIRTWWGSNVLWLILSIISIIGNLLITKHLTNMWLIWLSVMTVPLRCLIWIWILFIDRWFRGIEGFAELRLSTREPDQEKTPRKRRLWWRTHEQNEVASVRLLQSVIYNADSFFLL